MTIVISGDGLSIADIGAVTRGAKVKVTDDPAVLARVAGSLDHLRRAVARGDQIYGVTTLFGGMADRSLNPGQLAELQRLALWHHKSTTGPRLPVADVRAAMLLRANSLIKGVSGVRLEIVERFAAFLNAGAHPHVYQRGSIGASGDLVPLTYIAGAVLGLAPPSWSISAVRRSTRTRRSPGLGWRRSRSSPRRGWRSTTGRGPRRALQPTRSTGRWTSPR
jgi:phenylalanine ammonia-lyase